MKQRRFLILLAAVVLLPSGLIAEENAPHPDIPELKVLDRYNGTWKGTTKDLGITSETTSTWTLKGRFMKQEYRSSDGTEGVCFRGYDPNQNFYIMSLYDTNGTAVMLTGQWDDETNTLTCSAAVGNGVTFKANSTFPDDRTEEWTISMTQNGNTLFTVSGTNRKVD